MSSRTQTASASEKELEQGLDERLTELDVLKVFSQYGDIEDFFFLINFKTKARKNVCFLKYDSFESCVLAVDNLNNYKLLDRYLKVSHTNCKVPEQYDFKVYHSHILKKLDEAKIFEDGIQKEDTDLQPNDQKKMQPDMIENKLNDEIISEDPMNNISETMLEYK